MLRLLACLLALLIGIGPARAIEEAELAQLVLPPLHLGPRAAGMPVWTVLSSADAEVGLIFSTRDIAPMPGFAGTPIDILVTLDLSGRFQDLRLLSQNEPVFVHGLGPRPLTEFLQQYVGKLVGDAFKIVGGHDAGLLRQTSGAVVLDGVTKATASVNIANETIRAASLEVMRWRLGGAAPRPAAQPRSDLFTPMDWERLPAAGLLGHLRLTNAEVARTFAGSHLTPALGADPDGLFTELWFADLAIPSAARNLLAEETLTQLATRLDGGEEPILVMARGPYSILGPHFIRHAVPDLLAMRQGGFSLEVKDADIEPVLRPGLPRPDEALILRVNRRLGFDPGSPWTLVLRLVAEGGAFLIKPEIREAVAEYHPPETLFQRPEPVRVQPAWVAAWRGRAGELAALGLFLLALTVGLMQQRRLARHPRLLAGLRWGALAVTVGFVGWYAQGQVSIVNLLALLKALRDPAGLTVMLYDPVTTIVGVVGLLALLVWGRGTFCGWLCPFGALQDFAALLGRVLRLRPWQMPQRLHRRLLGVKYGVLALVVGGSLASAGLGDRLVEVEPFKTAITLGFDRSWPFVLYAGGLVALSMLLYKAFCRYLCPLGAFCALAGRLRRWDWVPRRAECGTPCRLCENRCRYQAIDRQGRIDYAECFQCLDCVELHDDARRCVPLVLAARRAARAGAENGGSVALRPPHEAPPGTGFKDIPALWEEAAPPSR